MTSLRELEQAATRGPWIVDTDSDLAYEDGPTVWWPSGLTANGQGFLDFSEASDVDAALIAATRNALPALLDVVDAARNVLTNDSAMARLVLHERLDALDRSAQ